jgi:hypothetical protein
LFSESYADKDVSILDANLFEELAQKLRNLGIIYYLSPHKMVVKKKILNKTQLNVG